MGSFVRFCSDGSFFPKQFSIGSIEAHQLEIESLEFCSAAAASSAATSSALPTTTMTTTLTTTGPLALLPTLGYDWFRCAGGWNGCGDKDFAFPNNG